MRNLRRVNWKKRVISVALVIMMVITLLPADGLWLKAEAAGEDHTAKTYSYDASGNPLRVRNVLDAFPVAESTRTDSAEWNKWLNDNWYNKTKGTIDRPFTVLEIVPHHEFAEFGYLIEGCEPIRVEDICGTTMVQQVKDGQSELGATLNVYMPSKNVYFFADEDEGQREYYNSGHNSYIIDDTTWQGLKKTAPITIHGYYEVVANDENNRGNYEIKEVDGKKTISPVTGGNTGNIVWHSIEHLYDQVKGEITFYQPIEDMSAEAAEAAVAKLDKVGARLYTGRKGSESDPYYDVQGKYCVYENRDAFVRNVIGLSAERAKTYSVNIKTITAEELNAAPEWVDLADFIYINPEIVLSQFCDWNCAVDFSGASLSKLGLNNDNSVKTKKGFDTDITWTVAQKIIERIASPDNYIGLAFNGSLYTKFIGINENITKKNVVYNYYDANNEKISSYYNEYNVLKENPTRTSTGYYTNMAKLYLIAHSLNVNLFKKLFLDQNLIYEEGNVAKIRNRDGDQASYWSEYSFLPADSTILNALEMSHSDVMQDYYRAYGWYWNLTQTQSYANAHVYEFKGDKSVTQSFVYGEANVKGDFPDRFKSFNDYIDSNEKSKQLWVDNHTAPDSPEPKFSSRSAAEAWYDANLNSDNADPWLALRYVLDLDDENNVNNKLYDDDIYVLEIEPSVGLDSQSKPAWRLTKSMVYTMAPNCTGDVFIDSMTMSAFIGKADDVNGKYDIIYLGDDDNGFWKDGSTGLTDFYKDNSLDGLLYFHMGDLADSAEPTSQWYNDTDNGVRGTKTVDFIDGYSGTQSRFPGNDISQLKVKELESFLAANDASNPYRVLLVAADRLCVPRTAYNSMGNLVQIPYVQEGCNIDKFLKDNSGKIMKMSQIKDIAKNYQPGKKDVTIVGPKTYEYTDAAVNNTYLNPSGGSAFLKFSVTVPEGGGTYMYKLYYDQDRNGKFTDAADLTSFQGAVANAGTTEYSYQIDPSWVGFVQWKIVVYRKDNANVRTSLEGCSAVKPSGAAASSKPVINALQICPDTLYDDNDKDKVLEQTLVDLTGSEWRALYEKVTDFTINVWKVTRSEYEAFFADNTDAFVFDMGEDISDSNPNADVLKEVGNHVITEVHAASTNVIKEIPLSKINMFIVGFGDTYGRQDISNKNGAMEYLYYQAAKGDASLLFTHDVTSAYNKDLSETRWPNTIFGYTANVLMRDIMGMNRYGASFKQASTSFFRAGLADDLAAYRGKQDHDVADKAEKQGFTYYALLKKIAIASQGDARSPYRFAVEDPEHLGTYIGGNNGNSNDNALTNVAAKLNDGQITQYPFTIYDNSLKGPADAIIVGNTHAQWYQLNMEDPELTVWMTLEDPKAYGGTLTSRGTGDSANGLVYGASPQDAANNYYIYSKGNIFYSGAGHSGSGSDMERKLFVNTMIAAYRPLISAPTIEVTNASWNSEEGYYQMQTFQDFDVDEAGNLVAGGAVDEEIKVTFKIYDTSGSDFIKCKAYYENDNAPLKIYDALTNAELSFADGYYQGLLTSQEYYVKYQRSDLSPVMFEAVNKKIPDPGTAELVMISVPLFRLD